MATVPSRRLSKPSMTRRIPARRSRLPTVPAVRHRVRAGTSKLLQYPRGAPRTSSSRCRSRSAIRRVTARAAATSPRKFSPGGQLSGLIRFDGLISAGGCPQAGSFACRQGDGMPGTRSGAMASVCSQGEQQQCPNQPQRPWSSSPRHVSAASSPPGLTMSILKLMQHAEDRSSPSASTCSAAIRSSPLAQHAGGPIPGRRRRRI